MKYPVEATSPFSTGYFYCRLLGVYLFQGGEPMPYPVKRYKIIVENKPFPDMRTIRWDAAKQGYRLEKTFPHPKGWYLKKPGHPAIGPFTLDQVKDYLKQGKPASPNVHHSQN